MVKRMQFIGSAGKRSTQQCERYESRWTQALGPGPEPRAWVHRDSIRALGLGLGFGPKLWARALGPGPGSWAGAAIQFTDRGGQVHLLGGTFDILSDPRKPMGERR